MVASTLLCAVVCWGENINAGDADRTNKLVIKAVFVAGAESEHPGGLSTGEEED